MRSFGTHGRVRPEQHYVVPRTAEIADFIDYRTATDELAMESLLNNF